MELAVGTTASDVFRVMDQELKFPEQIADIAQDETLATDLIDD